MIKHATGPARIALLYLIVAGLAALLIATTMPPLQNADEAAHAMRADQISHFGLLGQHLADGEIGGRVDTGLVTLTATMSRLPFHRDAKVSRAMYAKLPLGPLTPAAFPNTAVYPPVFYVPATVMVSLCRGLGIALPHALILMRLAMAAATITIGAVAILLSGGAAIWLYTILLLPMAMALSAAVTQDGPMQASTALAVALCLRLRDPLAPRPMFAGPMFVGMCGLLALVAMARPPYAVFVLLVFTTRVRLAWRLAGAGFIILAVAAWAAANRSNIVLPHLIDPPAQLAMLLRHPWRLAPLLLATARQNAGAVAQNFVGTLGWLDVDLPLPYHAVARVTLVLAAAAAWLAARRPALRDLLLVVLASLAASLAIVLTQYLTWTQPGAPIVNGLQGRYFLPPALLLGAALGSLKPPPPRWHSLAAPVLLLPLISLTVTLRALLLRYYF